MQKSVLNSFWKDTFISSNQILIFLIILTFSVKSCSDLSFERKLRGEKLMIADTWDLSQTRASHCGTKLSSNPLRPLLLQLVGSSDSIIFQRDVILNIHIQKKLIHDVRYLELIKILTSARYPSQAIGKHVLFKWALVIIDSTHITNQVSDTAYHLEIHQIPPKI